MNVTHATWCDPAICEGECMRLVCRGCYALGTACDACERCKQNLKKHKAEVDNIRFKNARQQTSPIPHFCTGCRRDWEEENTYADGDPNKPGYVVSNVCDQCRHVVKLTRRSPAEWIEKYCEDEDTLRVFKSTKNGNIIVNQRTGVAFWLGEPQ